MEILQSALVQAIAPKGNVLNSKFPNSVIRSNTCKGYNPRKELNDHRNIVNERNSLKFLRKMVKNALFSRCRRQEMRRHQTKSIDSALRPRDMGRLSTLVEVPVERFVGDMVPIHDDDDNSDEHDEGDT